MISRRLKAVREGRWNGRHECDWETRRVGQYQKQSVTRQNRRVGLILYSKRANQNRTFNNQFKDIDIVNLIPSLNTQVLNNRKS